MIRQRIFNQVLQERLPEWIARGLVPEASRRAILDDAASQAGPPPRYLILALYLMGVILLGAGIITFVAAHWNALGKAAKLALLLGGLWGAYLLAWWSSARTRAPHLSQALLLLGVLLFGANINLIAQAYHIEAHYPNGVLTWGLGGLLVAYALGSQPAWLAGMGLLVLWSGMEVYGFEYHVHWPFLILWAAALPAVVLGRWRIPAHGAIWALLWWMYTVLMHAEIYQLLRGGPHVLQFALGIFAALALLGRILEPREALRPLAPLLKRYGALTALICFYILTFPDFWDETWYRETLGPGWLALLLNLLGLLLPLAGALWLWRGSAGSLLPRPLPRWAQAGGVLLLLILIAGLVNAVLPVQQGAAFLPLVMNLLYFGAVVWMVYTGYVIGERFYVNVAFLAFGVAVFARYFDSFWSLLDRSYFFMGGGLLLLVLGLAMEPQRRRLMRRMGATPDPAGGEEA